MHYPLTYETDAKGFIKRTTKATLEKEMNNSKFLGQEFFAHDSYYPRGCFRHKYKRTLIAVTSSSKEVINAIQRNIYIWSKELVSIVTFDSGLVESIDGVFHRSDCQVFQ
jgi:hypothetical protein